LSSTFVIGDVHGCYHTLMNLVDKLPKDADLIFVGDLCDKGLYTKEVIEFVKSNNYRCVLGNHDVHMKLNLENALHGIDSTWSKNKMFAGDATVNSYKKATRLIVKEHIAWLKSLPQYIEIGNFLITHGFALPFYKSKLKKREFYMRVNRISNTTYNQFYEKDYEKYDIINIFGHDAFNEVLVGKNYYGIDTNCKNGNKLTAIELGSMKIIDVKTNRKDLNNE